MPVRNPVKVGQHLTTYVEGITHAAEGVGRVDGFTVFVPDALPGDVVEAEVISVKPQYARALISKVVVGAPDRVTSACPYYAECGGCQLMHAGYEAQLRYKEEQVRAALKRIGGLEDACVKPIIPMPRPYHYRNKAQFPVGLAQGKAALGCYKRRSHAVVPVDTCLIQHNASNAALAVTADLIATLGWSVYDEAKHQGLLRHVLVRHAVATHETMIVPVVNGESLPRAGEFVAAIRERLPNVVSVKVNINRRRGM